MLAAGIGIAPIPSVLQTDVQTDYTIQRVELVLPRGNAPRSLAYQASALLLSYRREKGLPADALQAEGRSSIEEGDVRHCATLVFGVHKHSMPEWQRDGFVIAVAHRSARINAGVAAHDAPTPTRSIWICPQDRAILFQRHSIWVMTAEVHRLATASIQLLDEVRLARTTTNRFVAENQLLVHDQ